MNILMVGSGKGSWEIRGIQLGVTMGARVMSTPALEDWRWADAVVLIKRASLWAPTAHRHGKPLIWDALDFWRQPSENGLTETEARIMFQRRILGVQPDLVIGATAAMAEAAEGVYLPHHAWPGLVALPARPTVQTVAYEGNVGYLGRWYAALVKACTARGWTFVVNPHSLVHADIVVALRDGPWDGWMCREWKSGVKVVNAMVAGRPLISQASAAMRELRPAGTIIERFDELDAALDLWTDEVPRARVVQQAGPRAEWFNCNVIADQYRGLLTSFLGKEATL
jgi:hypothetical protein